MNFIISTRFAVVQYQTIRARMFDNKEKYFIMGHANF